MHKTNRRLKIRIEKKKRSKGFCSELRSIPFLNSFSTPNLIFVFNFFSSALRYTTVAINSLQRKWGPQSDQILRVRTPVRSRREIIASITCAVYRAPFSKTRDITVTYLPCGWMFLPQAFAVQTATARRAGAKKSRETSFGPCGRFTLSFCPRLVSAAAWKDPWGALYLKMAISPPSRGTKP